MRAGDGCAGCRPADSLQMGLLLAATGGFLDAYTYVARGRVFANAQTGNLVLLGLRAFETDPQALRYLVPVCAFVLGIVLSEFLKARKRALHPVNWRQAVLGVEALVLVAAAFLPERAPPSALRIIGRLPVPGDKGARRQKFAGRAGFHALLCRLYTGVISVLKAHAVLRDRAFLRLAQLFELIGRDRGRFFREDMDAPAQRFFCHGHV